MTSIINTITARYVNSIEEGQFKSSIIFDSITKGIKKDNSVIQSIIGNKTRYSANVCREANKQIGTGINVAKTAMATLTELQQQVENLKLSIIGLNVADGVAISTAQTNYVNQMQRIYTVLNNADYGGKKLFDGSIAKNPSVKLPSQSLPGNGAPWKILDSSDPQSTTTLTIPRLLAGDGTPVNLPVKDTFESLFPVTNNTLAALTALNNTPATAAGAGLAFADQRVLINTAIPAGVNAEQDYINFISLRAYDAAVNSMTFNGVADTNANATLARDIAIGAGGTATLSANNTDDINKALALINSLTVTTTASAAIAAVANDNTVSHTQRVFLDIAAIYAQIPTNPDSEAVRLGVAQLLILGFANNTKAEPFPNPVYIGSVMTAGDRKQALEILTNMSDKLTAVIADVKGFDNGMQQARVIVNALTIQLSDAAASCLNTDFETSLSQLSEISRKTKVGSIAYALKETQLNKFIQQLISGATAE